MYKRKEKINVITGEKSPEIDVIEKVEYQWRVGKVSVFVERTTTGTWSTDI